jgi:drug/metabolite transporter (DMT)-like permease
VLAVSVLLLKHKVKRAQLCALAVSYAGVLLVFGHEVSLVGTHYVLCTWCLAQRRQLRASTSLQRARSAAHGALRLTGWATSVACLLCLLQFRGLSAAAVGRSRSLRKVLWLSLLQRAGLHLCAGLMVMMAMERIGATADRADRHDRPLVDHRAWAVCCW